MWYFRSPEIVFGEDALEHLATLNGQRAFIVTDEMMVKLGYTNLVAEHLQTAGIAYTVFDSVEQEPALRTIQVGAAALRAYAPDWIIGLGGGSAMDAAKAMWILYENPDIDLTSLNPFSELCMRQKARLITIPTTSGTGAECTWALVLTDIDEQRKLGLGTPEILPDLAIIDPIFPRKMPSRLTADTGFDVLTQAIEGYTALMCNDFSDGLCLKAIQLVFDYLLRAVRDGKDMEAREKMHNAATLAGLGFGNSMAALAHALGHSFGAICHVPHGRAVGLFLPYTIQFNAQDQSVTRYAEISRFLNLPADTSQIGATSLVAAIRTLAEQVAQPLTILEAVDLPRSEFEALLDTLIAHTEADSVIAMSRRIPTSEEIGRLFKYAYAGKAIDF